MPPLDFSQYGDPVDAPQAGLKPLRPQAMGVRRLSIGEFVKNPDGSRSTERSITITHPEINAGQPTNIPSIWNVGGKIVELPFDTQGEKQAIDYAVQSGDKWPSFASIDKAVAAAKVRSAAGGRSSDLSPATSAPLDFSRFGDPVAPIEPVGPPPAFDDQSFMRRSVINPLRVGGHQLGVTAGSGGAAVSGQRIQALNKIDELQAQGKHDDAFKYVLDLQDAEISEYARIRDPVRRQELRDRITSGLTHNIGEIGRHQKAVGEIPRNPRLQAAIESRSILQLGRAIVDDPEIILQVTGESLPQFAPGIVAAPALGPVTAFGGASLFAEHGQALLEGLKGAGVDVTNPDALRTAFENPAVMEQARDYALKRSLPVAIFDAVSGGVASRMFAPRRILGKELGPVQRELANIPAQMPVQGALGAGGEAAGQYLAKGEINPAEVALEAIAEVGGAIVETPAARLTARRRGNTQPVPDFSDRGEPISAPQIRETAQPSPEDSETKVANPGAAEGDLAQGNGAPPTSPQPPTPEPPAVEPSGADFAAARTGQPIMVRMYRGEGRADQGAAYTGAAIPIMGEGRYYATDEAGGRRYGPTVTSEDVALRNPLVIDSDDQWRTLAKEAGWKFPNPHGLDAGEVGPMVESLNRIIRERGHDGVIVRIPDAYRQGQSDDGKLLDNVFGGDQAVVFGEKTAETTSETLDFSDLAEPRIEPLPPDQRTAGERGVTGDAGTVPKRLHHGLNELTRILDEADRQRADEQLPAEVRKCAEEIQLDTLARLEEIETRLLASDYGREWQAAFDQGKARFKTEPKAKDYARGYMDALVGRQGSGERAYTEGSKDGNAHRASMTRARLGKEAPLLPDPGPIPFKIRTARGREVNYALVADIGSIADLRARLGKKTRTGSFARPDFSQRGEPVDGSTIVEGIASGRLSPAQAATRASAGVRHQSFRQDAVEGEARETPLRREAILKDFAAAFGVPIYQGRIQSRKVLGFYRRRVEEVRLKRMNDIETASHEMAHLMNDRVPEIRRQWSPASNANADIREELRAVSYDDKKLFEGFAEFVRLWMTQNEQAELRAPSFFGWFEDFVARSEYGPALKKARDRMQEWFEQDAVTRARSKIGEGPGINEHLDTFWGRFRQGVTDDLEGIRRMELGLTGELSSVGAYETARLTRGKHALVEGALLYGAPKVKADGSHTFVGKGLKEILDPVADNLDDALMYFVGRSASELMGQGRERLFTRSEIAGMLALETPERKKAFGEYQEWNRRILDFAQAKGVIDPAARFHWKRAQYLPFHRVGQPGQTQSVPGAWEGIKALTGGTENIRDVLQNMIGNAAMLIDAATTNEARLAAAKLAKQRGGARFMAQIPTEDRTVKVPDWEVKRQILDALGVGMKEQLPIETQIVLDQIIAGLGPIVRLVTKGNPPVGPDVVAALRQGKPVFFEVADPLLYRALTALNRPARHWLVNALSVPKRIGQDTVTLTFDFMGANFFRDQIMGGVMSRHGFKPFMDGAKGLASRVTADPTYRDFIANGGGFASYLVDEHAFKVHLERFYTQRGIDFRTVIDSPSKMLYALEKISNSFEMATRIGEYRKAVQKGEHPRHAAFASREVSTDFGMRGDSRVLGFLYDTVIFLKAGINGMDRFYRGLAEDPNRAAIAGKTALLAAASVALYALNRDNPLYDQLEDWDRDLHWHVYLPTPAYYDFTKRMGRDPETAKEAADLFVHLRFPKIWEVGAIASIAERQAEGLINSVRDKSGKPMVKAQKATGRVLLELFSLNIIPQAVEPIAESIANRIFFLDRPIETKAEQSMQPWARSGPYTSPTIRKLGEWTRHLPREFQISPKKVEALIRGYLHTWGMYGLMTADAAFFDDVPDLRSDQYPLLRRFYQREPARNTKYMREMYDMLKAATEARRTMRHMDRAYRPKLADEIENTPENLAYRQLTRADKFMQGMRAETRRIHTAPDLAETRAIAEGYRREPGRRKTITRIKASKDWNATGSLKRALIEMWVAERNELAERVAKDVKEQRRVRQLPVRTRVPVVQP